MGNARSHSGPGILSHDQALPILSSLRLYFNVTTTTFFALLVDTKANCDVSAARRNIFYFA